MPKVPKIIGLQSFNISKKIWRMNLVFCLQINIKGFFKLLLSSYQVCVSQHAQIIQKKSLLFLCNILIKNWVMKLIFCMQVSMKACYKYIVWGWARIPKVPKVASLHCLYSISKKNLKAAVNFLLAEFPKSLFQYFEPQSFLKGWYNHYQWPWSSVFKLLKVTSWQYLCSMSKKKLGMEIIFGMHTNVKVSSWYYGFWWK